MSDADEYQRQALRTEKTPDFVVGDDHRKRMARTMHGMIGVCTEAGELQDMVKKYLIYGKPFDAINVLEECGDLLWYIALALEANGFTLSDCMARNIAKLRKRFPDRFTEAQALTRNLDVERAALERSPMETAFDTTDAARCLSCGAQPDARGRCFCPPAPPRAG